jgi:CHAD domain-containing protein
MFNLMFKMNNTVSIKHLSEFYKTKEHDIVSYINDPSFYAERIHKFRVSIKRMKIIFHLFDKISSGKFNSKKNFKIFKDIFETSGQLREDQLTLLNLSKYNFPSHLKLIYKNYVLRDEIDKKTSFRKKIRKFDIDLFYKASKKIDAITHKNADNINIPKVFFDYFEDQLQKIIKLKNSKESSETIHILRKHFKTLHSIVKLMNDIGSGIEIKKMELPLNKIENSIGKWHDRYVFITSAELFLCSKENSKRCLSFLNFKNKIEKDNALQLKKVYSEIDNFLNTFNIVDENPIQ